MRLKWGNILIAVLSVVAVWVLAHRSGWGERSTEWSMRAQDSIVLPPGRDPALDWVLVVLTALLVLVFARRLSWRTP